MRNKILLGLATLGVVAGTAYTTHVFAQEGEASQPTSVLDRVVERFDLNQDEVDAVIDEVREERQAQMLTFYEERLDEAVAKGELTAEQKQLILDKHAELQAEREQKRAKLQAWAEENGIDLRYLMGGGHRSGFHKMHGMGLRGF